MLKNQMEKFKSILKNDGGDNKKKIENLVFLLVLLIITIIAINVIWSDKNDNNKETNTTTQLVSLENTVQQANDSENDLQTDLKHILGKISGAGQVEVLITYTQTSELVPLYNETVKESVTEEKDTSGGVRTIEQKDNNKEVVYTEEDGEKQPITQKVIMPKIEGAVILAEGANNALVKNNIIQAVEAVTGLSSHKIQVFELEVN